MPIDSRPPAGIRVAQAAAILLATTTAGANASLSAFAVPRILEGSRRSGEAAARRWAAMYADATRVFPTSMIFLPVVLNSFLSWFFFSAARGGSSSNGSKTSLLGAVYAAVAAGTFSIVPFTLIVLGPIHRMLLAREERGRVRRLRRLARRTLEGFENEEIELAVAMASLSGQDTLAPDDDEETMASDPEVDYEAYAAEMVDRETTHALVDRWGVLNLYHSAVGLLAGCAGLYAVLS